MKDAKPLTLDEPEECQCAGEGSSADPAHVFAHRILDEWPKPILTFESDDDLKSMGFSVRHGISFVGEPGQAIVRASTITLAGQCADLGLAAGQCLLRVTLTDEGGEVTIWALDALDKPDTAEAA